jgi:hypothetical protein
MHVLKSYVYIIYMFISQASFSAGRMVWEASMGSTTPGVTNRCRGNVYANRYRSNGPIVCVVLEHTLDKPLHVIYKVSKLAYRIGVILIANERV